MNSAPDIGHGHQGSNAIRSEGDALNQPDTLWLNSTGTAMFVPE